VVAPPAPGDDWVIAGTTETADGSTTATVWRSLDATAWTRLSLPGTDGRALAAASLGTRTVVVGSVGRGATEKAAVWLSAGPGEAFAAVAASPAFAATASRGSASMDVVAAGTLGVFASGSVSGIPAMWYSSNGSTWSRVADAEKLIDAADDARVRALLVDADGVYAAGSVRDGTETAGAIWSSGDGIHWSSYSSTNDPFLGAGDHEIDGLASNDGALVAVGGVRSATAWSPASWISPNGATWSEASEAFPQSLRPQPGTGGSVARAVAVDPAEVAAGGTLNVVGGSATAQRLWTSTDGTQWQETALPVTAADATGWTADLVATAAGTTVIVDDEVGQPHVLVHSARGWDDVSASSAVFGRPRPTAEPVGLARGAGPLVLAVDIDTPGAAIGSGTTNVAVLSSDDGTVWRVMAQGGALAGGRVDGLAATADGLVAVGTTGSGRAAIWTSPTGTTWTVSATFGPGPTRPEAADTVTAAGPLVVASGTGPAGAAGAEAPGGARGTAVAWRRTSAGWKATGALDAGATLETEQPTGSCRDGRTIVVVGAASRSAPPGPSAPDAASPATTVPSSGSPISKAGQGDDGTQAATWSSTDGSRWSRGSVTPGAGVGSDEEMTGCAATATGFVAYGRTMSASGLAEPALWQSTDGIVWTQAARPGLAAGSSSPLSDLAEVRSTWLAPSGGIPAGVTAADDPAFDTTGPQVPGAAPTASTGPDGEAGLWLSTDAGATWSELATGAAPWLAGQQLVTDLAAMLAGRAIVAGDLDGRLAVWTGTAAPS
jgi:hypothetical protein